MLIVVTQKSNGGNAISQLYVNHPRYGNSPIPSEYSFTDTEIRNGHWRYSSLKYFGNTAIPAVISKQNFAVSPRAIYVDIEEKCLVCGCLFLFFALEQKWWFEELQFWVDSHCTRCIHCRRADRETRAMQKRYQSLVQQRELTQEESEQLNLMRSGLYQRGYIRHLSKLRPVG
ncbi:MAG: zinc-ribbon domain-containing protein [Pararheinheimera sp.]|nr:zinc-ribbon domain-containing protein [Rheinheimera sp.]